MKTRTTKTEYARALDLVTRYLALRDHSRFELRQKLSRRFETELIERVMTDADESGWIPSEEVIAQRTALAYQRRLKSRRYIEGQLKKRRLPVPARDSEKEADGVRALLEKKFGQVTGLSYEDKGKAYRYLSYRGFDGATIQKVLNGKE